MDDRFKRIFISNQYGYERTWIGEIPPNINTRAVQSLEQQVVPRKSSILVQWPSGIVERHRLTLEKYVIEGERTYDHVKNERVCVLVRTIYKDFLMPIKDVLVDPDSFVAEESDEEFKAKCRQDEADAYRRMLED